MPPEVLAAGLLASVLPPAVVTCETTGDVLDGTSFGVEETVVAAAVEARRREFATTRTCARRALRRLGLVDTAIPRGPAGNPVWPPGIVGSLTHCAGYRAAAIAWRQGAIDGIGIDAEPADPLPPEVLTMIADPQEQTRLARLSDADPTVPWDRLLFSAKESVYKARFPLTGQWLDFGDVQVIIDSAGEFSARVRIPAPGLADELGGRWTIRHRTLATAVVVGS